MNSAPIASRSITTVEPRGGSEEAAAAHGAPAELLPGPFGELETSADLGAQLTALIVRASREQRESARACRQVAEQAQRSAENKELEAMRDEADAKLVGGLVEGAAKIASGASGAAGDQALSSATSAQGTIGGAMFKHAADMNALEAKRWGQVAGREKRAVDDARDLDKDAKEMLSRALSYYKDFLNAKNETQRATLLRT